MIFFFFSFSRSLSQQLNHPRSSRVCVESERDRINCEQSPCGRARETTAARLLIKELCKARAVRHARTDEYSRATLREQLNRDISFPPALINYVARTLEAVLEICISRTAASRCANITPLNFNYYSLFRRLLSRTCVDCSLSQEEFVIRSNPRCLHFCAFAHAANVDSAGKLCFFRK